VTWICERAHARQRRFKVLAGLIMPTLAVRSSTQGESVLPSRKPLTLLRLTEVTPPRKAARRILGR
jgi:hypothetical protein